MSRGETGRRIYVVEDEVMVLLMIEDMLEGLGHHVVGTARKLEDALAAIKYVDFDLVILDANLAGQSSHPIASLLRTLGHPFVVASGYPEETLDGDYLGAPMVEKPFSIEALAVAIRQAGLGRKGGRSV
jgi:DNA-binding response OmpR family regulator